MVHLTAVATIFANTANPREPEGTSLDGRGGYLSTRGEGYTRLQVVN